MNKVVLLMLAATLSACGPSQPSETVDFLVAHPDRIKEIQRQCKEDRAKVGDELCVRAAEAAKRVLVAGRGLGRCLGWLRRRKATKAAATGWGSLLMTNQKQHTQQYSQANSRHDDYRVPDRAVVDYCGDQCASRTEQILQRANNR